MSTQLPQFAYPADYLWMVKTGLLTTDPNGPLQPWYLIEPNAMFELRNQATLAPWQHRLIVFARCDDEGRDLACFGVADGKVLAVYMVHDWNGFSNSVTGKFESLWEWVKFVLDDIKEFLELTREEAQWLFQVEAVLTIEGKGVGITPRGEPAPNMFKGDQIEIRNANGGIWKTTVLNIESASTHSGRAPVYMIDPDSKGHVEAGSEVWLIPPPERSA